jgi:hypothetical protein
MFVGFDPRVRNVWVCLVFVALTGRGLHAKDVAKGDGPANAAARGVHEEAVRILNSIQSTVHQHDTEIDEKAGSYRCDGSGFVGYVLNRTVAKEDQRGPLANKKNRPLAMDYERFLRPHS